MGGELVYCCVGRVETAHCPEEAKLILFYSVQIYAHHNNNEPAI